MIRMIIIILLVCQAWKSFLQDILQARGEKRTQSLVKYLVKNASCEAMVRQMANLGGESVQVDLSGWQALSAEVDAAQDEKAKTPIRIAGSELSSSPGDSGQEDAIRVRALQLLMLLDNDGTGTIIREQLACVHGGDENGTLAGIKHLAPDKISRLEWLDFVGNLQQAKGVKAAGFFLWHLTRNAKRMAEAGDKLTLPGADPAQGVSGD